MKPEVLPKSVCYGVTNKCADGIYVLFADYDQVYFHVLLKELDDLRKRYPRDLCNFAIFESTESENTKNGVLGSYHVINFAKFSYQKMREILGFMSVDKKFFDLPQKTAYRCNTLRVSPKFEYLQEGCVESGKTLKDAPRFICWYPTEEKLLVKRKLSSAHLRAYEIFCGLPKFKFIWKNEDFLKGIQIKKYNSFGV